MSAPNKTLQTMIWRSVSLELPSGVWHKAAQDSGAGKTGTGCEGNNVLSCNYMENVGSWHRTAALGRLCWDHTRICRQLPEIKLNARKGCINISDLIFGKKNPQKTPEWLWVAESSLRFPSAWSPVGSFLCGSDGTLASVTSGMNRPSAIHTFPHLVMGLT